MTYLCSLSSFRAALALFAFSALLALPLQAAPGERPVTLIVRLPKDSTLMIDGHKSSQRGTERAFLSPPLKPGKVYYYTLRATWKDADAQNQESRKVRVQAGERLVVDFTIPEPKRTSGSLPSTTWKLRHSLKVTDVPKGSKKARIWFWLPNDDEAQKVLSLNVLQSPKGTKVVRSGGNRYLYAEVTNPSEPIDLSTEFLVRRRVISTNLKAAQAKKFSSTFQALFREELRKDVMNMEVTPEIQTLADRICGDEKNVAKQAQLLFNYVVGHTYHYKHPKAKELKIKPSVVQGLWHLQGGSASRALECQGGSCTDQHSLFIALARARGIPTRLEFGSLLSPTKENQDHNPGYRCWVSYFVPNYGWVPMDASAANLKPKLATFYAHGLDANRIRFFGGRDVDLSTGERTGPHVNLMIIAYVEIDGKPHVRFERTLRFHKVK